MSANNIFLNPTAELYDIRQLRRNIDYFIKKSFREGEFYSVYDTEKDQFTGFIYSHGVDPTTYFLPLIIDIHPDNLDRYIVVRVDERERHFDEAFPLGDMT